MKTLLFSLLILLSANLLACSENLETYPFECQSQDRFLAIKKSYQRFEINPLELKEFKLRQVFGRDFYDKHKQTLLIHQREILSHEKEWKIFHNAQLFLDSLNSTFMTVPEILNLHQAISKEPSLGQSRSDKGILRNLFGFAKPKLNFTCEDQSLNALRLKNISALEFKTDTGDDLIELKNIKECENPLFFKGTLVFIKGASVNFEMNRWLNEFNDTMFRFERGYAPKDLSPYQFLSDMKRWFLALRPFHQDNEEMVNSLLNHALSRLNLPPVFFIEDDIAFFVERDVYRERIDREVRTNIRFFDRCLDQYLVGPAPLECTSI